MRFTGQVTEIIGSRLSIEKVEETVKNQTAKDDKETASDNETVDDVCLTIPDFWMMG